MGRYHDGRHRYFVLNIVDTLYHNGQIPIVILFTSCKVSEKYRKVLGIRFFGDTGTLKLTQYPILRVLGIDFVP